MASSTTFWRTATAVIFRAYRPYHTSISSVCTKCSFCSGIVTKQRTRIERQKYLYEHRISYLNVLRFYPMLQFDFSMYTFVRCFQWICTNSFSIPMSCEVFQWVGRWVLCSLPWISWYPEEKKWFPFIRKHFLLQSMESVCVAACECSSAFLSSGCIYIQRVVFNCEK